MTHALSVGVPVYNGEDFLAEALSSIQEQDFADIEIVVSDNGSTDGTEEMCRRAAAQDERIRYLRSEKNRGGAWNYRRVVEASSAPFFSWQAADDIKAPSFYRLCADALAAHPEAPFACCRTQLVNADSVVFEDLWDANMGLDAPSAHERVANLLTSQASHVMYGLIRRDAMKRTRGLLPLVGDDMVLLTELLCQGPMVLVPEQLFYQRRHPKQFSAQGHDQVKWHAPDARTRFAFPQTRLNLELFRAVRHSELPAAEKARTWATIVPSWVLPRWKGMAADVRVALGVPPLGVG